MLLDEVNLTFRAGHGGPGKVSFRPGKKGGPDGGNGGRGGDIYLLVSSDLTGLNQFSRKTLIEAENGKPGDKQKSSGRDGFDLEVTLPIGTELVNPNSGEVIVLDNLDMRIRLCKGGLGGRGNFELRSSRNTTPMKAQPGLPGQEKFFQVNLKLIADYGFVGLPNAGKSSLLNELTAAHAKVAPYAFTTLEPNLGVLNKKILADIPGLIEGASEGKGLGIKFLKHIEKVGLLLHCIAADSDDVVRDYQVVRQELEHFSETLAEKKELILLTKTDLVSKDQVKAQLKLLKKFNKNVMTVSIHDFESIEQLKKALA